MNVTYQELRATMRHYANDLSEVFRFLKRVHDNVLEQITPIDLLRTRIPPLGEGEQLGSDGIVRDAEGNVVADYRDQLNECKELMSAYVGFRCAIALLMNDSAFLSREGVLGVYHWGFIEKFADWRYRGGL